MLALTEEELAPTDTTEPARDAIVAAGIREILMLGRRGPAQAAFTTPELQELGELAGADVVVDPADLELDPASEAALADDTPIARRNVDVLREFAARKPAGKPRVVNLRFCVSPVAILGDGKVEAVEIVRNALVAGSDGRIRAEPTSDKEVIPCGIVFRSVGYHGVGLPGVPFDEKRGTIPNEGGRVRDPEGSITPGVYCTGWIKRGPSGVIGTNKKDATETAEHLLEDARAGLLARDREARRLDDLVRERGTDVVMYAGWEAIDAFERAQGEPQGRPRVKLCSWDGLLAAARG
jgi:ferredoxin--NADP+ reductase